MPNYKDESQAMWWDTVVSVASPKPLLPCPFCGGSAILLQIQADPEDGPGMGFPSKEVRCRQCNASTASSDSLGEKGKLEAIAAWNIRVRSN